MADAPMNNDTPVPEMQDTPPEAGGGGESWVESFVPEEFRGAGFVTKYDNAAEFFKGMDNLNKLAGQKAQGLIAPGEDATDEERAAFAASLRELSGVPGSLDEYMAAMKMPDLEEGAMLPRFVELAHAQGVPPTALQNLIDGLGEEFSKERQAEADAYEADLTKNMDALKKEWDAEFDYKVNLAERFASEFSDETLGMLKAANWTNKAPIVRDLAKLAEQYLAEGELAEINRTRAGADTPTMAGLTAMKMDPRYADPDKRDESYVSQVHEYAKRLTADMEASKN
ncbi:hypothetical protein [Pseudodesulfovibrio pelocollis]|uniref:hypothetical protein n=1 Tax=Pseudodesulfovibrio pelocollis TaxID=3051432 RepID=UPI00255AFE0E|nr:hypothetical protein [Pseudodesulfovibrio sp. SB368]